MIIIWTVSWNALYLRYSKKQKRIMNTFESQIRTIIDSVNPQPASWAQAGQEIVDLVRLLRTSYNELVLDVVEGDAGYVESLDWNAISKKGAAAYNQAGIAEANRLLGLIDGHAWCLENVVKFCGLFDEQ